MLSDENYKRAVLKALGPAGLVAALLLPAQAVAAPVILACDLVGIDGSKWHLDYYVDLDAKTVNQQPATITQTLITFDRKMNSGNPARYMISRITGSLTVTMDSEVLVNGTCAVSQDKKF